MFVVCRNPTQALLPFPPHSAPHIYSACVHLACQCTAHTKVLGKVLSPNKHTHASPAQLELCGYLFKKTFAGAHINRRRADVFLSHFVMETICLAWSSRLLYFGLGFSKWSVLQSILFFFCILILSLAIFSLFFLFVHTI